MCYIVRFPHSRLCVGIVVKQRGTQYHIFRQCKPREVFHCIGYLLIPPPRFSFWMWSQKAAEWSIWQLWLMMLWPSSIGYETFVIDLNMAPFPRLDWDWVWLLCATASHLSFHVPTFCILTPGVCFFLPFFLLLLFCLWFDICSLWGYAYLFCYTCYHFVWGLRLSLSELVVLRFWGFFFKFYYFFTFMMHNLYFCKH